MTLPCHICSRPAARDVVSLDWRCELGHRTSDLWFAAHSISTAMRKASIDMPAPKPIAVVAPVEPAVTVF